jgi:hypothetical protein
MGCINSKEDTIKPQKAPVPTTLALNVVKPEINSWDQLSSNASPGKSELKSPFLSPISKNESNYGSQKKHNRSPGSEDDSGMLLN